jgi:hypothetical protein
MSINYQEFHAVQLNNGTREDPITLEELSTIAQNGRQTIGYLRCVNRCPLLIVHYSTESAFQLFVSRNYPREPETNSLLNPGFIDRINLYRSAITRLSPEQLALSLKQETPELEAVATQQKKALFCKYLTGLCTPSELLLLKISLFIDDTNVLQVYNRAEAEVALAQSNVGNWLIRQSSIRDTDLIKIRAISFKQVVEVKHIIIVQIYGYGFMISPEFPTNISLGRPGEPYERVVATMGSNIPLPIGIVYPSFIDALNKACLDRNILKTGLIGIELQQVQCDYAPLGAAEP